MFRIKGIHFFIKFPKNNGDVKKIYFHSNKNRIKDAVDKVKRNRHVKEWKEYAKFGSGIILSSLIAYDGAVNDFTYCGAGLRFLRSVKTATLIAFDYLLLNEHDEEYENKLKEVHLRSANRLLHTCLKNGGLYIKVGQGVAAVNHILPKEYIKTLMKLQDECLVKSKIGVQKVFLDDFGKLPEKIFAKFDYTPIAAASLAQVFKAELKTGETVAVKVQYHDLQKRFVSDLGTIIFLQKIVAFFFKNYNFGWILQTVKTNLIQELDFVNEGQNAELCASHMKDLKYVRVPKVYWNYSKKRVLTLEWMEGRKISDLKYIKKNRLSLKDIDKKLFEVFATQIFDTGFVHADPHSSNVFVRRDEKSGRALIILLDHGLYETIEREERLPLCEFWEATVLRNKELMKTTAEKLNITEYMKFAEVLFQQPMQLESTGIKNKLTDDDIREMQNIARQNFDRIMVALKAMPRNLLFVVRNLNTIRAISRQHGDVVDRPKAMARHAQYFLHKDRKSYLRWIFRRIYFEYCLWISSVKLTLVQQYFKLLYYVGRAPKSAKTVIRDILKPPYEAELI